MPETAEQMHAYYAARAPYYDDVYLKPERKDDIAFLAKHLPAQFRSRDVLEIACGTGYWTQHIAKTALRLVASDYLAEPLAFARQRPGVDSVEFRQADAYALPADLGTFDAVFAGLWFSHIPIERRTSFLDGIHALLMPGARVIFIDNTEVQLVEHQLTETDDCGNTYQMRPLKDGSLHRVLKNFPSEGELVRLLGAYSDKIEFSKLQNFWMVSYEAR